MSVYPYVLDDDTTIVRVDDNVTEISGENFNQVRDAVFKLERELGITPSGTKTNLAEFLGVSHNQNGTIKESALAAVGLVTLPIDNADVGANAGILESKLTLDYSTSSLFTLIQSNKSLINAISAMAQSNQTRLNSHIAGGPSASLRHVASHIDLNAVPTDTRDPLYNWAGLKDKDGNLRSANQVADALLQINNDLTGHQNQVTAAHPASAISVNTDPFTEIPSDANTVQKSLESLDSAEQTRMGIHRATMHSDGVSVDARSEVVKVLTSSAAVEVDGYGPTVVLPHKVQTFVGTFPGTSPVDSVVNGDLVVKFLTPTAAADVLKLDAQFSQVKVGDSIRINYGDGYVEAVYTVESFRFTPGSEWFIRINGNNLYDTADAYARIDRPLFDPDIQHVVVAAPANVIPAALQGTDFMGSITVADPRAAMALGIGFDPNQIDSTHYKLYLQMYPTGRPEDRVINLSEDTIGNLTGIDVSGNAGATPGEYTLDSVVQAANDGFRAAGFNYRFLAFQYNGNFGICMTDAINGVSFSIVSGDQSSGTLAEGSYTENVIGDAKAEAYDALGLGAAGAGLASPVWRNSYVDSTDAQFPTIVLMPRKKRYYMSNGTRRDFLRSALGVEDGYWEAKITNRTVTGSSVEVTYTVEDRLEEAGLKVGKTLTVQPSVALTDPAYQDVDYGRFMIKEVTYVPSCPGDPSNTLIKVVNGIHGDGNAIAGSTPAGNLVVRLYFGSDTTGFNLNNMVDSAGNSTNYHRLHEIYVNNDAKTFSHERARMQADQAAAGDLLGSANWHISDVSPKLKGFLDSGSSSLHRWVRFFVSAYNATSGEFDGYIGRRDPSSSVIYDTGPITTARKNVPARFYDHSGNDFVELTFIETGTSASTISAPAYVDIEIFQTLSLDDELLLLATAEINWQPQTGQQIVERVIDRRPIGSVSELEFTQSAKDFIKAVDSHVHANGVIRGFDFVGVDTTDTSGSTMKFDGGVALVNGTVATVNPGRVRIPEITNNAGGSTVNWAICVNEQSKFEIIPITFTKSHFFAVTNPPGTPYYISSVTPTELSTVRKDLTPIALVTATIASVTLDPVVDIRKWVENESINIPLVVVDEDNKVTGSFRSLDAALWWAQFASEVTNTIKVRGDITVDSEISLSGFDVTIEGEGSNPTFEVTSDTCFRAASGLTIRNCNFRYSPPTAPTSGNFVNAGDNGCIVFEPGIVVPENVTIENCTFTGIQSGYHRWPQILFKLTDSNYNNVNIRGNTFTDVNSPGSPAIVIYDTSTDGMAHSTLDNWHIEKNVCNAEQGIYIVGDIAAPGSENKAPISVRNFHINGNQCGKIGFFVSSDISPANTAEQTLLDISDNICYIIYSSRINGGATNTLDAGYGNVLIRGNSCSNIGLWIYNFDNPRDGYTSCVISENMLTRTTYISPTSTSPINAIDVYCDTGRPNIVISNNTISAGQNNISASMLFYLNGIEILGPGVIVGNSISGFTNRGINVDGSSGPPTIVQSNTLFRNDHDVGCFINADGYTSIIGNSFDSPYIDEAHTDDTVIDASGDRNTIANNKNHRITMDVPVINGNYSVRVLGLDVVSGLPGGITSRVEYGYLSGPTTNRWTLRFQYFAADGLVVRLSWFVGLGSILPAGASIDTVTLLHSDASAPTANDDIALQVGDGQGNTWTNNHGWTDDSGSLTVNVDEVSPYDSNYAYVQVYSDIESVSNFTGNIYTLRIVYML